MGVIRRPFASRRRSMFVGALLLILLAISLLVLRRVYAQKLFETSKLLPQGIQRALQPDEAAYYQVEIRVRRDPTYVEPPDPYHMEGWAQQVVQPLVVNVWLTSDTSHTITTWKNAPDRILRESINTPEQHLSYLVQTGDVFQIARSQREDAPEPEAVRRNREAWLNGAQIDGVQRSAWGGLAWRIRFPATPATPDDFASSLNALHPTDSTPFAADLDFQATQWVWEIAQETRWLVSRRWLALTQPEPTVLYAETFSQPEILPKNSLPFPLDQLQSADALKRLHERKTKSDDGLLTALVQGRDITLEALAAQLTFPLFTLSPQVLDRLDQDHQGLRIYYTPTHKCHLARPLAYDFDLCAGLGGTVRLDYILWSQEDYSDAQSIQVSLGPASVIVPLLRQAPPRWLSSRPVALSIQGQPTTAWLVSALRGDPGITALLFVVEGVFVQLTGDGIETETLVQVAETMLIVAPARARIFLPKIVE